MLISEIISSNKLYESVELSSTVRSIASEIGNPITSVYDKLNEFAQRWSENHDTMKGFAVIAAGVTSRWYESAGENLISELHHLADQAPSQASSDLRRFLRTNNTKFEALAKYVTPILVKIGQDVGFEPLTRNARAWWQQQQEYQENLEKYEAYASSSSKTPADTPAVGPSMSPNRGEKVDQAAAATRALKAQQQSQIEQFVNSVSNGLRSGVAGEIRNAIAREPNKLFALQRELSKRNIKL